MTVKNNQDTQEYFFQEGCYITEFWNENRDDDVSVAKARVMPGQTTRKHALANTTERYLVLSGKGLVYIGSEVAKTVKTHDVVLIPPSISQCIKNTGKTDLVFLAICTPRFKPENYQALE